MGFLRPTEIRFVPIVELGEQRPTTNFVLTTWEALYIILD